MAVAMVALAGCATDKPTDTSAAPTTKAPSNAAPPSSAPASPAPSGSAGGGCPVDAATLKKAFQANAEVARVIVLGKGFKDISCYQGYATAKAQPENVEAAAVLFKYDTAKKSWVALRGGTDGACSWLSIMARSARKS